MKEHIEKFDNQDDAYDFIHGIGQREADQYVVTDREDDCTVVARFPGGRYEMTIEVIEVEFITGYIGNPTTGWEQTTKTGHEVIIGEVSEHTDRSVLGDLFASWTKVFGGQQWK